MNVIETELISVFTHQHTVKVGCYVLCWSFYSCRHRKSSHRKECVRKLLHFWKVTYSSLKLKIVKMYRYIDFQKIFFQIYLLARSFNVLNENLVAWKSEVVSYWQRQVITMTCPSAWFATHAIKVVGTHPSYIQTSWHKILCHLPK